MVIYTTNRPRTASGVMQYAKVDFVDCLDLRQTSTVVRNAAGGNDQIDATLITAKTLPNGQLLYFEGYDAANANPNKRDAIFEVKSVSLSSIGRNQYSLQFKENNAA